MSDGARPELFVGVDGGATRTAVLATDEAGVPLARLEGGAGLVDPVAPEAGVVALLDLVDAAIAQAGEAPPVLVLCCALAGAGGERERLLLEATLTRSGIARDVLVVTDAEAALHDAFGAGPGILLVSGTGSIAFGRGRDGRVARTGGWGLLLGDEGSGYALGRAALRAVCRAQDGRGERTLLTPFVVEHTGVAQPRELIPWAATAAKADIAALAPGAIAVARHGDMVAADIVDQAISDLAGHVNVLVHELGPWDWPVPVALAGGLIAPGRPLRDALLTSLRGRHRSLSVSDVRVDGARGAAALARSRALD